MALDLGHRAYRQGQVGSAPFFLTPAQIGEGRVCAIGAYGDHDLQYVFDETVLANLGAEGIYIGRTLSDALAGTSRLNLAAPGGDLPSLTPLSGEHDALYVYNAQGSGGTADISLHGRLLPRRNSGGVGHPGNGEFVVRATPVANATTVFTITVRAKITVTFAKTWSKVPASGAACTLAIAGPGGNLLLAATVDVTGLTTVTYQTQALTATVSRLDLDPGQTITLTVVGGSGLTPGDLLVALGWSLR